MASLTLNPHASAATSPTREPLSARSDQPAGACQAMHPSGLMAPAQNSRAGSLFPAATAAGVPMPASWAQQPVVPVSKAHAALGNAGNFSLTMPQEAQYIGAEPVRSLASSAVHAACSPRHAMCHDDCVALSLNGNKLCNEPTKTT